MANNNRTESAILHASCMNSQWLRIEFSMATDWPVLWIATLDRTSCPGIIPVREGRIPFHTDPVYIGEDGCPSQPAELCLRGKRIARYHEHSTDRYRSVHANTHRSSREGRRFCLRLRLSCADSEPHPRPLPGVKPLQKVGSVRIPSPIAETRRTLGEGGLFHYPSTERGSGFQPKEALCSHSTIFPSVPQLA
jgi:hypothetical protein